MYNTGKIEIFGGGGGNSEILRAEGLKDTHQSTGRTVGVYQQVLCGLIPVTIDDDISRVDSEILTHRDRTVFWVILSRGEVEQCSVINSV